MIPLPNKKYSVIYADPPWSYYHNAIYKGKNAHEYYQTMSTDDICLIPIQDISDVDCVLFLWAVLPSLPEAIKVGESWGFKYKTVGFVWDKQPPPVRGAYTMSQCELCLIFKKGKIPQPRGARNIRQFISSKRGRHSEKPSEVRDRIVQMFPSHNRVELFARETVDGWDSWGNEVNTMERSLWQN